MPLLDEHGVSTGEVPAFVNKENLPRWLLCVGVAQNITRLPVADPECLIFAKRIFDSNMPTGDAAAVLPSESLDEAFSAEQWRNRLGRWIDMPDMPKPHPRARRIMLPEPPASPGISEEQIAALGLDKPPQPGDAAKRILGEKKSTAELYVQHAPSSPGVLSLVQYDDARVRDVHDRIVQHFMEGREPPKLEEGQRPRALFTAGGPASGKTTTIRENPGITPPEENTIHIDADRIKEMLPEYREMVDAGDHYAAAATHLESGDIAARLMHEAMEQGYHVVIDQTGDGEPGTFRSLLDHVNEQGYGVEVVYVNVPTDVAVGLSIERARTEGRFVPIPVVRDQHQRVSANFVGEVLDADYIRSLDVIDSGEVIAHRDEEGRLIVPRQFSERFAAFVGKGEPRG